MELAKILPDGTVDLRHCTSKECEKYKELKSQTKLETYTIQNNIKTKNGKDYTRWGLKNILTNPVYAIADKDTLEYFKSFGIDIYANEEDFDGEHGLMVYNKTENR